MEDKIGMLVAREDPISIGVLLFPPPPPSPPPTSVQTKLQPTFQTSFKRTTQWLKEP